MLVFVALFLSSAQAAPVTLADAWSAAESSSPDLALLRARTRETEALRGQAWSLVQPKLVANASYTLNSKAILMDPAAFIPPDLQDLVPAGDPIVLQPKHAWQGSFTVQQSLFSGQALPTLLGAYKLIDATRLDEARQVAQVKAGVAKAYYGLFTARQAEVISAEAQATAEQQLDLARKQVAAELAPPRAVVQAELAVSQAARDVQTAHERRVQAEEAFHQLTGLARDSELTLPEAPPMPASLDDAIAAARSNRPDLQADAARIDVAKMQSRATWAGWAPEFDARYTAVVSPNAGAFGAKSLWMVVVSGNWTLWDGGYRLAKAREAAAQQHEAELFSDRAQVGAESEVRNAWETWHRAQAALDAMDHEVALAEQNLDLARRGFEAQQATMLEVQQAELGVRAARLSQLVERMNRDLAAVDVAVATGGY
jgi:outer membrane protein